MSDERDKTARPRGAAPDKAAERRHRQAEALRRNLARRKAQMRDRAGREPRPGRGDGEPPPDR